VASVRTRERPVQALRSVHLRSGGQTLVLAVEIADFATADADVAGGDVDGGTDVANSSVMND